MSPLTGILVAMPVEARAVLGRRRWQTTEGRPVRRSAPGEPASTLCVCSGVGPARAAAACRWLIAQGATGIVSFGVAGGLHPDLRPGALVVADEAVEVDGQGIARVIPADRAQARQTYAALIAAGVSARLGAVVSVSRPVRSPAAKAGFYARYRALTVDMETGAVLQTAREAGLPVRILRAVCDPADRCLPQAVAQGVAADGRRRPGYVVRQLLADHALLVPFWRAGKEVGAALAALKLAWQTLAGGDPPWGDCRA